eukprot:COSAG01_NODE_8181_length_2887_cov_91.439383_1_plen_181_part_00
MYFHSCVQPTGIQREFVVEAGDADLDFQLASDLSIQSVAAGGKSERAGVCVGMRLCSFQGQSTLAVPYRDLICRMAHTPRPWMFVVEDMHHPEHTGPTVFQLAQHIKADVRNPSCARGLACAIYAAAGHLLQCVSSFVSAWSRYIAWRGGGSRTGLRRAAPERDRIPSRAGVGVLPGIAY